MRHLARMSDAVIHVSNAIHANGLVAAGDIKSQAVINAFRLAFNHVENPTEGICSWLTAEQANALAQYRQCFELVEKSHWDFSQLNATEQELRLIMDFKTKLESEKKLLTEHDTAYCTDLMLLRYLRARDLHLDRALKLFIDTLAWRAQQQPWAMENFSSRTNKTSSDARIVGFDRLGRVVIYSSFAHTTERTPEHVKINTVCMMEKANLCVNAHSPGNVIWVNHFGGRHKNGFGMRDCNPKFAWTALHIFSNHYPECLQTMIIVDPPSIFFTLWKTVKPMLPEKTQQKGEFIDSQQDNRPRFVDMFGEELADHLLRLIAQDAK